MECQKGLLNLKRHSTQVHILGRLARCSFGILMPNKVMWWEINESHTKYVCHTCTIMWEYEVIISEKTSFKWPADFSREDKNIKSNLNRYGIQ